MAERHYSSVAAANALTVGVDGSATSIILSALVGFPSAPFTLVIDPGSGSEEIVTVTNVAGTTLTVIRGEDGSAAVAHNIGAVVRHKVTGRDLREAQQHIYATEDVHGVDGELAGVTDTQTLTNKTISGAANTITNVAQSSITNLTTDLAGKQASGSYATSADLTSGLAGKSATGHHHTQADIDGTIDADTIDGHAVIIQTSTPAYVAGAIWFKTP